LKFLILDHYYPAFLQSFYHSNRSGGSQLPFEEQRRLLMDECFGTSDFYSRSLEKLGHQAEELVVNCQPLQRAWTKERAPKLSLRLPLERRAWEMTVVDEQVRQYKPDVLFLQNITYFDPDFVAHIGSYAGLVVGQTAYPLDWSYGFGSYDLIVTSFPHYVERFRNMGVHSAYLALAFEPTILPRLSPRLKHGFDTVFVGGVSTNHERGIRDFEEVSRRVPLGVWGYGADKLPSSSPLYRRHQGEAWGLHMYNILANSRVALNRHIDVSQNFANNMRMFEGTGVGTCLLTDFKVNVHEFFDPDREIVCYESGMDCMEKALYLLEHERERSQIAQAGQRRTLRDHTYARRMEELVEIVQVVTNSRSKVSHPPKSAPWKPPRTSLSQSAKEIVRRSPAAPLARWAYRSVKSPKEESAVSVGHHLIDHQEAIDQGLLEGWKSVRIPRQQRRLVDEELKNMYRGETIPAYKVAAEALDGTGVKNPQLLEIGCSSAYYSEVLPHLLKSPIRYTGIDFSEALLRLAAKSYPGLRLALADAKCLPFHDSSWEVVFSSGTILHILDYAPAIEESFRVSAGWCIYHRTPVTKAQTTLMSKLAYGVPVLEFVFNEAELLEHFRSLGADVVRKIQIDTYRLPGLSAPVELNTYTCRKR